MLFWNNEHQWKVKSFPNGKQPKNSLPNVLSMSWHFVASYLYLLSQQLVLLGSFLFFPLVFFLFLFFVRQGPLNPSKFMSVWSEPLWDSFCNSSYSIFKSLMNSFHLMVMSCDVLSFMFFTKKHFSTNIKVSSSLILFIEVSKILFLMQIILKLHWLVNFTSTCSLLFF